MYDLSIITFGSLIKAIWTTYLNNNYSNFIIVTILSTLSPNQAYQFLSLEKTLQVSLYILPEELILFKLLHGNSQKSMGKPQKRTVTQCISKSFIRVSPQQLMPAFGMLRLHRAEAMGGMGANYCNYWIRCSGQFYRDFAITKCILNIFYMFLMYIFSYLNAILTTLKRKVQLISFSLIVKNN